MNYLIPVILTTFAVALAIVSGRSLSLPDSVEKKSSDKQGNVIILEAPVSNPNIAGDKAVQVEGEKLLLRGKNFSSLDEMVNIIEEEKKGRNSESAVTQEPFSIVVPVARNFSSLKELFEILRESPSKPIKPLEKIAAQTYVKGTEKNSSEYMIFFTT